MDKRSGGPRPGIFLALLLGTAALVAGLYFFLGADQELPPEDAAPQTTASEASPSPSPSSVASYKWGEVVLEVEQGAEDGTPNGISVYFVNEGRVGFSAEVLSCATVYSKKYGPTSCYGFPSIEAFEFAEVDPETGGMKKKCWQAYYSVAGPLKSTEKGTGAIDSGQAEELGCPTT